MTQPQRITLEEPRAAGYPVVKRTALGQTFNGAILKAESRDRLKRADNGTMVPIVKDNGKHAQELVATCLTLPGTTAPVGLGEEESVPAPGDIVRLILKGKSFGDWIESKKSLQDGTVAVGDIVTMTTTVAQVYDQQGNPSGPEITDQDSINAARQRGRSVGIYGPLALRMPKPDSEWYGKAVEAYQKLSRQTAESNQGQQGGGQAAGQQAYAQQAPTQDPWDSAPPSQPQYDNSYVPDDEPPF